MVMGGGKVAEIKAGDAGHAVLPTARPTPRGRRRHLRSRGSRRGCRPRRLAAEKPVDPPLQKPSSQPTLRWRGESRANSSLKWIPELAKIRIRFSEVFG